MLSDELKSFLQGGNFATFTTLLADGRPASQVMWIDCDDVHVLINTEVHRRKFRSVSADPRVVVCAWALDDPYSYREIRGVVVETVHGAPAREHIDQLSLRYFGRPYDADEIESERVILKIRPETD